MSERLTKKQKGFVKDYIETGNGVQSALNNYDTTDYSTAGNIASENLDKPKIIEAIADAIPDDLLVKKHLALLNKTDDKGEIDVSAVSKGLDMGYKIKGSYAPDKSLNFNINQQNTPEVLDKAEAFTEWYKKHLSKT
jgi:hypothetical protein